MELIGLFVLIATTCWIGWIYYKMGFRDGEKAATALLTSSRSPLSPEEAVRLHGDGGEKY